MENKTLILYLLLIIVSGCTNVDHKKIIINNSKKTISVLDSNFVIDSFSISKFGKPKFSISLKNKRLGSSYLDLNQSYYEYKNYVNDLNTLQCNDINLNLSIIIRKKGESVRVTQDIANNFKQSPFIQILFAKYSPCSKETDTIETSGFYK
jgi:hypothetical protein